MGRKIDVGVLVKLLVFLLVPILFYYPVLFGNIPFNGRLLVEHWSPFSFLKFLEFPLGVPFKFTGIDEVLEFYPLLDFTYDSFRSGSVPLWNPYNFSGYSHIGNWASAVFYPIHLSMFLFSKSMVLIILKVSAITLPLFFTYIYLRALKLSVGPSLFGGFAFAFSATMQIWNAEIWQSAHSFLWLPLALFSIEKLIHKKQIHFSLLLGVSIAMSIMAGYTQPTIYLILFTSIYSIYRLLVEKKKDLLILIKILAGYILGLSLSAVQLFPAVEAFLLSPRSKVSLHDLNISFLLDPVQLVTLFVPDFFGNIATMNWFLNRPGQYYENMIYIGVIPLSLMLLALFYRKLLNYSLFFLFTVIISLSLAFDIPTSRLIYDFSIPFLSSAIPIRIIFLTCFSLSVLSAISLDYWLSTKEKKKILLGLLPILVSFLGIGAFIYYAISNDLRINSFPDKWYLVSARNFVIPFGFFMATVLVLVIGQFFLRLKKYLLLILLFLLFSSSSLFVYKYFSFSEKQFLYPKHPLIDFIKKNQKEYRYWGYGSADIPNNLDTVYRIYSPEGYDPVNNIYYNELLSSSRRGAYEGTFSRSDALLYAVTEFPFKDTEDTQYRIMDLLGIKYIGFEKGELVKIEQKRLAPSRYKKVWEKDNFIIFENRNVLNRVFLANRYILRSNGEASLKELYNKKTDLKNTVVVSENLPFKESQGSGNAKILNYSANRVLVETNSESSKILVLTDSYYPGWKAKVNGIDSRIHRVNYALRGVIVPPGKSVIEFYYFPQSFYFGALVSTVSILFAGAILFKERKNVFKA